MEDNLILLNMEDDLNFVEELNNLKFVLKWKTTSIVSNGGPNRRRPLFFFNGRGTQFLEMEDDLTFFGSGIVSNGGHPQNEIISPK